MIILHCYRKSDGIFTGRVVGGPRKQLLLVNETDEIGLAEGVTDPMSQRVDIQSGALIDYQPPAPDTDHYWNVEVRRWNLKPEIAERNQRRTTAQARIDALERKQPRALREIVLGRLGAAERLQDIDNEIAELRKDL